MNYLNIIQDFKICTTECSYSKLLHIRAYNYLELVGIYKEFEYDHDSDSIRTQVKIGSQDIEEEAIATSTGLVLTSDNSKISYSKVRFIIRKFCNNSSKISINDYGDYCSDCYQREFTKKLGFPELESVLETLKSPIEPTKGLSVSKKIQYILQKNPGIKMTSGEIYKKGNPWLSAGITPKNTVAARCSTMFHSNKIKKDCSGYFLDT
jgi:hypothetical protein